MGSESSGRNVWSTKTKGQRKTGTSFAHTVSIRGVPRADRIGYGLFVIIHLRLEETTSDS
jgi:hypothetical protein